MPLGVLLGVPARSPSKPYGPRAAIEIWALALDGSGVSRRLTYFNEYAGYGANNPVISSDGRKMAFGLRVRGAGHGNAEGILIFDFEKASTRGRAIKREPFRDETA